MKTELKSEIVLRYAHCTKATPRKLDQDPWFKYELRELPAVMTVLWDATLESYIYCIHDDKALLAAEETQAWSIAKAQYHLMDKSRNEAIIDALSKEPKP